MFINITNTLRNGSTIKALEIDTNFNDIVLGLSDGTKEIKVRALTLTTDLNITGETVLGNTTTDEIAINSTIYTDILSDEKDLGSSTYAFKSITLDNAATDGGAIYFDGGTTNYIKADASGALLTVEGFSTGIITETDGYLRLGTGEDLEISVSSDDAVIRNRTSDKDIKIYASRGGTDTEMMRLDGSTKEAFVRSVLDGCNINLIINGDFQVWQRATSILNTSASEYFADRFYRESGGTGTVNATISRSNEVPNPDLSGVYYSAKIVPANTNINADAYFFISQKIEGYNIHGALGCPLSISFWVRSSKTGIYSIALRNSGTDYSIVSEYEIETADTWEYKRVSIDSLDNSTGTWDYTNGCGLELVISLKGSTTYDTSTLDSWQAGNYFSSTNQVNFCDSTSNEFYITNISLSKGKVFYPFNHRRFSDELQRCQRYYEKSYDYEHDEVNTFVTSWAGSYCDDNWFSQVKYAGMGTVDFLTRKRSSPILTIQSPNSGADNNVYQFSDGSASVNTSLIYGLGQVGFNIGVSTGIGNGQTAIFQYIADAEIY